MSPQVLGFLFLLVALVPVIALSEDTQSSLESRSGVNGLIESMMVGDQPRCNNETVLGSGAASKTASWKPGQKYFTLQKGAADMFYTGIVYVGSPPKPFRVSLSTQSSRLWLFDKAASETIQATEFEQFSQAPQADTHKEQYQFKHNFYENGQSHSNRDYQLPPKEKFEFPYIDGAYYTGSMAREDVKIGKVTLHGSHIGLVDHFNYNSPTQMDGILGLGFEKDGRYDRVSTPQLLRLANRGVTSFSFYISESSPGIGTGKVSFNYMDPKVYLQDTLSQVSLEPAYPGWVVKADKIMLGRNTLVKGGVDIAVEIGSSQLVSAPRDFLESIRKLSSAQWNEGGSEVELPERPCLEREDKLLDLKFFFGKTVFTFTPSQYFREENLLPKGKVKTKKWLKRCKLLVSPIEGGKGSSSGSSSSSNSSSKKTAASPQWLLGIDFLKNMYTKFDYDKRTMSFAKLSPEAINGDTTRDTSKGRRRGGKKKNKQEGEDGTAKALL